MEDVKLPLVVVRWYDAWVRSEEPASIEEAVQAHKPELITTLGWVLQDDAEGIQLANEYYDGHFRGRTFIYRPMIKDITPYKLVRSRKARKPKNAEPVPVTPTLVIE